MKEASIRESFIRVAAKVKGLDIKKWLIILAVLAAVLFGTMLLTNPRKQSTPDQKYASFGVNRICELATLECYYHNVTEWGKPSDWKGFGAKRIWIEYDGIVHVGVKADQIRISDPDSNNVITVAIPNAIILDKDIDVNSIYEIDSQELWAGIFKSTVTADDRAKAIAKAQNEMGSTAAKKTYILNEARERAKMIIERNIKLAGEAQGKQYTVKFVDAE